MASLGKFVKRPSDTRYVMLYSEKARLTLKVGDSGFLQDDERRHDTGLEILIPKMALIALKYL